MSDPKRFQIATIDAAVKAFERRRAVRRFPTRSGSMRPRL